MTAFAHRVRLVLLTGLLAIAVGPIRAQAPREVDTDALLGQAYEAAYRLDHAEAIALARAAVAQDPDRPGTHRTLASVIWQTILFQRGAVTVDHFMPGMTTAQKHLADPDEALAAEFHAALDRALALAEAQVAASPDDAGAHYEVGAAHGLAASYTASIEGSLSAAFRKAKGAFDAHERALEIEPDHPHALAVVGTYRYLVSSLGLASRLFAYIVGFGGGKDRGIAMLEQAVGHPSALMEAGTALVLIYSREDRHAEAYAMVQRLAARHPANRLLMLEQGATALRAGRPEDAERILTRGLETFARDERPKVPGERAIWLFKRGMARLEQGAVVDAGGDLRAALASDPQGWMEGRIRTGLGKAADLDGEREEAVAHYVRARAICERFEDERCRNEARSLIRRPYAGASAGLQ